MCGSLSVSHESDNDGLTTETRFRKKTRSVVPLMYICTAEQIFLPSSAINECKLWRVVK